MTRTPIPAPGSKTLRVLRPLFRAAFGHDAPFTSTYVPHQPDAETVTYEPLAALHLGSTTVLLSKGNVKNDCHGCSGVLSIHYLKKTPRGWRVTGHWSPPVDTSWGSVRDVSVLNGLMPYPVVSNDGGMANCGCSGEWNDLIELTPHGAKFRTQVPVDSDQMRYIRGPGPKQFTVRYSRRHGSVTYRRVGERYDASRNVEIEDCSDA